ncbi:MAG: DUF169 domain-containing protein [Candidatus Hermodarchaeota archaeon]
MNKFQELKDVLYLDSDPIGVKLAYDFVKPSKESPKFKEISNLGGYCEYVKRASQGEYLKIQKGDFSCHTGNVTLGFLESDNLELTMKLDSKGLKYIYLFPINKYIMEDYDSIILILNPHNCMNLIHAYVNLYKKPLKITCGAINGVCIEVTAHVIKRNEINFSFLCPSSRKNRIFSECELLCGIPARMTNDLIDAIKNYLYSEMNQQID